MNLKKILLTVSLTCAGAWAASLGDVLAAGSPPVITAQPQTQTAYVGANLNLRVAATSSLSLRYRWRFHGTDLPNNFPGQSTPLLMLQNVSAADAGPYSVVVSNSCGAVTSQTAVVSVNMPGGGAAYVNLSVQPGYALLSVPLSLSGANQTVASQFPAVVEGASLFKLDGNGFIANNFLDGWSAPEVILNLGEGWFFHNPSPSALTLTVVGGIQEGMLVNRLPAGLSLCASLVPQAGPLSSLLGFPATPEVFVLRFDRLTESYFPYVYDSICFDWIPSEPTLNVGEAFFALEPLAQNWTRFFTIMGGGGTYLVVQPLLANQTGEINFFTYHPNTAFGRVLDLDGATPVNGQFMGQLYAGPTSSEAVLLPIGKPVPFLDGAGAGYIRSSTVKLPGVPGGQTIFFQLRVWEKCAGDTYEQAVFNGSAAGRSTVVSTIAHATVENGGPGLAPRNANSFPSFSLVVQPNVPLRVARIRASAGQVEICFATRTGFTYCVQKAPTAGPNMSWTTLPGAGQIAGTGHTVKITDPITGRQGFYRVCRAP